MFELVAPWIARGLVVVHGGLALWALTGLIEWFVPAPPWTRLSNPLFSRGMLLLQWSLILLAASTFITGYLRHWPHTPTAMAVIYAAMAGVCAYQTFFILEHDARFRQMAVEYLEYALILAFLFGSSAMRAHFHAPQLLSKATGN